MSKQILYSITAIMLFMLSCSSSEDNQLTPSPELNIKIIDTNPLNSKIEWTNTSNTYSYNVYLGKELIAENLDKTFFEFEELKGLTEYQGEIIAFDTKGQTVSTKQFTLFTSEKIFEGSIELKNQKNIDNFTSKGYNTINGNLIITDETSTITNLSNFKNLQEINGDLIIVNSNLTSLNGLNNVILTSEEARLLITNNNQLINIEALSNITSLGSLYFIGNNLLQNLNGLHKLKTIRQELSFNGNPSITSLHAFQNLQNARKIKITGNKTLDNLNGLNQIQEVNVLVIKNNPSLLTINGLQNLTKCELYLTIEANAKLTNLNGLSNLTNTGTINIVNNTLLNDISSLSNLKSVSYLVEIKNNTNLTSLNGIQNIVYDNSLIDKKLFIQNNPEITTLEAISNYTFERGIINISGNNKLVNFCGLKKLLTEIKQKEYDEDNFIYNNAYNPNTNEILNNNCSSI